MLFQELSAERIKELALGRFLLASSLATAVTDNCLTAQLVLGLGVGVEVGRWGCFQLKYWGKISNRFREYTSIPMTSKRA